MSDDNVKAFPKKKRNGRAAQLRVVEFMDERDKCKHDATWIVDEKLSEVECSRCHAKLNPTWCMLQMARQESRWMATRQEYIEIRKLLPEMRRTKCDHCGRFTTLKFKFDGPTIHRIQFGPFDREIEG